MTIKLKMKMTQKMKIQFKSNPKHGSRSWMNICVFLFFPLIAANAFAQEVTAFDLGVKPEKGNSWCIAAAPDGSIWLAEKGGHRIEKIAPSGAITEFKTKNVAEERIAPGTPIAFGPDGNLWLLEAKYVSRITKNGEMTQYAVPMEGTRIFAGPDDNMSFLVGNHIIFKINMQGVVVDKFDLQKSPPSAIVDMVARPDGSVWYTASDRIGKITRTGDVTEYTEGITKDALAGSIALGADGNMWFAEDEIGKVAKITPTGVVTEYKPLTHGIAPGKLVSGRDGNIWVIDKWDNRIVKIAPDGVAVGYHVHDGNWIDENKNVQLISFENEVPSDLTVDLHGNIWFVGSTNWVRRLTIAPEKPAFDQTMSTQEIVSGITTPKSPIELLKNIQIATNLHLVSREDFYTEQNLKKFFGGENTRWRKKANGILLVDILNFHEIAPPRVDVAGGFDSVDLYVARTVEKHGEIEGKLSLSVMRAGIFPSLGDIEGIFGLTWSEDRSGLDPHRVQSPSNRIIYEKSDREVRSTESLEFGTDGSISSFYYIEKNNGNE